MLVGHELGHEVVDANPNYLAWWHSEHFLYVSGGSRDDAHGLGVDYCFDHAGSLMVYELSELLQGVEVIFLVSEVQLLEILPDLLAIAEEAHFREVE